MDPGQKKEHSGFWNLLAFWCLIPQRGIQNKCWPDEIPACISCIPREWLMTHAQVSDRAEAAIPDPSSHDYCLSSSYSPLVSFAPVPMSSALLIAPHSASVRGEDRTPVPSRWQLHQQGVLCRCGKFNLNLLISPSSQMALQNLQSNLGGAVRSDLVSLWERSSVRTCQSI